jgi:RNA polymerase sigma-70 factor (ECF subfamily)
MDTLSAVASRQSAWQSLSDAEWVARAQRGDADAFERIMRQHNRLLFRTARSILKDDAETEDAVQAAYLNAWRALGSALSSTRVWRGCGDAARRLFRSMAWAISSSRRWRQ